MAPSTRALDGEHQVRRVAAADPAAQDAVPVTVKAPSSPGSMRRLWLAV